MSSKFNNTRDLKIDAQFTVGAEETNAINVAVQLVDRLNKNEVADRVGLLWYLSDDAAGDTPSATAPDGGVAIGTDGVLIEHTANLNGTVISESDGDIDITLTEAGADTWYLNLVMPDGKVMTSGAITFAA